MYTSILSATIEGLSAAAVQVEVDVSQGLPGFSMVGSAASQVREAQDRVLTALHNVKFAIPPRKITINLSPGDVPKRGTGFDLPIAAGIMKALGYLPPDCLQQILVTGEIGLDGKIHGIRGILPMVQKAKEMGCRACIVPGENRKEAEMIEGIPVAGADDLDTFIQLVLSEGWKMGNREAIFQGLREKHGKKMPDFADVQGQVPGKRAALLAAAGFHNLLLIGPPGSGKSMLAERIPGLLPPLDPEESLELSAIYSIAGMLPKEDPWIYRRPFRSPHHTISVQALAGGGRIPKPGEITLAHRGVLFLDELPEMGRASLEALRQPLEERQIWIARTEGRCCFPAGFLLVAAMNPCPCGYYPDRNRCRCRENEVHRYLHRISQPLLDRMDLCAETAVLSYREFRGRKMEKPWNTEAMAAKAEAARERQFFRYRKENFRFNGEIPPEKISTYCSTDEKAEALLQTGFAKLKLSGRACNRILRVARTAADLEGCDIIGEEHMAEAIGYRSLDKQYWK